MKAALTIHLLMREIPVAFAALPSRRAGWYCRTKTDQIGKQEELV
jgi:hypothetical protein